MRAALQVSEDDLESALQAAIKCTILAAAGQQRSRMLATLYKDERSAGLDVFPFLEKVYLERILRRQDGWGLTLNLSRPGFRGPQFGAHGPWAHGPPTWRWCQRTRPNP